MSPSKRLASTNVVFLALLIGIVVFSGPARSEVYVCSEVAVCQWGTMKGVPADPALPYMHILVAGKIASKDVEVVRRAANQLSEKTEARIAILTSLGGDVEAAIAIGRILRDKFFGRRFLTVRNAQALAF